MKKWISPVFLILAVIWMGIIFSFSAKTADESSAQSNKIGTMILNALYSDNASWDDDRRESVAEAIEIFVRKSAHACEFALLEILLFAALSPGFKVPVSYVITSLYAVSDELHQLFVPGRSCQISDVLIDMSGAALAVVLILTAKAIFRCHRGKIQV